MAVYGTANFSKNWSRINYSITDDSTFDMSNFYGYNYISLIDKGLKPEIIKFHPAAWFFSRNTYLWRLCSLFNNIFRHLKLYKSQLALLNEIELAHSTFPESTLGLHDFASTNYMSHREIIFFIECLNKKDVNLSKIIVCETELSGCFRYEDFAEGNYQEKIYFFGKDNINKGIRILNFFREGSFFE